MTGDWRIKSLLCLSIFLSLCLASCAWLKREQIQREREDSADQVQKELEAGRFQRAIDLCEELRQKYPQDSTVRSRYIETVEAVKKNADRAFEKDDFETAGNIYEILGKNWARFGIIGPSLSFDRSSLEKKAKTSRCLLMAGQVPSYIKAGEFQKAVDLSREVYRKYPREPSIRKSYVQILEVVKKNGDRAFERKDFEAAGSLYDLLLKHISSLNHSNGFSSLKKNGFAEKIKTCAKSLFEKGLQQYRAGNLERAISVWKTILAFDPGNEEAKGAVAMATLQLKNLEKTN